MDPKAGDNITFIFTPNVLLDEIAINSGNFDHPNDKLPEQTTLEIETTLQSSANSNTSLTSDGYHIIGTFEDGFLKINNLKTYGLVKRLRIRITKDSNFWLILNEIHIKTI